MNEQITGLASLGRFEDNKIAHVADGEMVIPPLAISLATKRLIFKDMLDAGINPANYVVGSSNSINPYSGLPEFFLKKLVSKIIKPVKKVVKFQTGLAKKAVKANLKLGKKIVKSDLFKTLAPIGAMFIPGLGPLASMALSGGLSGLASGGGLKAGLGGALSATLGGLAGGLRPGMAPNVAVGSNPFSSFDSFKKAINPFSGLSQNVSDQSGIMSLGQNNSLMQLVSNVTDGDDIYNQQRLQNFYNKGMGAAAGLAVPAGILSYLAAKKERDNPLKDVRDTLRPDLKLGGTFGKGGFDLGFAEGGEARVKELEKVVKRRPSSLSAAAKYMKNPAQSTIVAAARGAFPIASTIARFNPYGAAVTGAISLYSLYKMSQNPEGVGALAAKFQKDFEETMTEAQELFNDGTKPIQEFVDKVRQGYMKEKEKEISGYAEGGEVLDMRDGGESEGPGTGTSDDIPAMLSDGEFVMTASANKGLGGYKINKSKGVVSLTPSGKPDRKKGAKNMMNLMKTFEKYNEGYA